MNSIVYKDRALGVLHYGSFTHGAHLTSDADGN